MTTARLLAAMFILVAPDSLAGQEEAAAQRLAGLARAWGHVKYHHPYLAYQRDIDWDSALVRTVPLVLRARSPAAFRTALSQMLATLGDPLTRVVEPIEPVGQSDASGNPGLVFRVTPDSVLIVTARDYYALSDSASLAALQGIRSTLPSARGIVFDLRSTQPVEAFGQYQLAATLDPLERLISGQGFLPPGERRRVFYGYRNPSAFSSGQYRVGFFTRFESPTRPAAGARDIPSVFLLNSNASPPPSALVFQASGQGRIVHEGEPGLAAGGGTNRLALSDGLVVEVRISEPVHPDGTSADLVPDLIVRKGPLGSGDAALDTAVLQLRGFQPSTLRRRTLPAVAAPPVERSYSAMEYPSLEYRLLGLARFWSTIHYFYPYKQLLDQSWDSVLLEFLPRFRQAEDAIAYNRAIAEMATRLHDSHAYVAGTVYYRSILGEGYPPVRVRIIEGLPVIVALTDSGAVGPGLEVGSIVTAIDGEDAQARLLRYQGLISASTPQSARDKAALAFMNGPIGVPVRLRVRGVDGRAKEVLLTRRREDYTTLYHRERNGDVVRLLPGNIGYVDLDRLTFDMVDSMFVHLRQTRAIIFDMRGYPNGTVWAIAPRLTSQQQPAAWFETPMVGHDSPAPASESFLQTIPPGDSSAWLYTGRTIMLIDERAQSQAEHTGLFLRAANGTRFVGDPTAGANGELTTITLPGGVTVGFTGQSVKHPDGTQLQRVGLIPDVPVSPTIQGIREGRDEVLEAAIRALDQPQN